MHALRSDAEGRRRFHYEALQFNFQAGLVADPSGLLIEYPCIARRVR